MTEAYINVSFKRWGYHQLTRFRTVARHAMVACVSAGLFCGSSAWAGGSDFQPAAVSIWSVRTTALAGIARDNDPDGRDTAETMIAACKGLQGAQMSNEYGKVPNWALKGQLYVCEAYKGWAKQKAGSGECKLLQQGLDFLGKADPAIDPPQVVESVAAMAVTGDVLMTAMKSHKHAC